MSYVKLLRPFTLFAPFVAGVLCTLTPTNTFDSKALMTGLTLAFLQAFGQVVNQIVDRDLDAVAKPHRPIPRGDVSLKNVEILSIALLFLGLLSAIVISFKFFLWSCLIAFMAGFYSLKPFSPRKVNPWLNHLWVSVSRGPLPVLACYTIYGSLEEALRYSLLAFVLVFGWQGSKDVLDADYDRMFGIKTIASVYGERVVEYLATTSVLLFVALTIVLRMYVFIFLLPAMIYGLKNFSKKIGDTIVAWRIFYIILALFYVVMFFSKRF
ncbi:MAG: UbiA family prenyltransferase [Ignisphaera sp.]